MVLNFVFTVHSALALVVALMLFFYADWVTPIATGIPWTPGQMADAAEIYARFCGVGLLLIVIATSFARLSGYTQVRLLAVQSMILISVIAMVVSYLFVPFNPLLTLSLWVNLLFIATYLLILVFNHKEI